MNTHTDVAKMAKLELHLHIEGAMPPAFARELAAEKGIDLSGIFDEAGGYKFKGFLDFLRVYEIATSVLQSPDDFYRLTRAVLAECVASNVVYAETFLAPDFCGGGDVAAWQDYLAAIKQGADEMEAEQGIILRAIPTIVRHFGAEQSLKTAECAVATAGDFVTGFGMGGDENFGAQRDYKKAFDMAAEAGLRLTTHAGEWGGPASVRDAIRDLNVERVGHGVQCIEDGSVLAEVIERGVTLEVCPGSNVVLGVVPDLESHPIERLRLSGAKVTVSTDDPPFFHTTMAKEFADLNRVFGWEKPDFDAINQTALAAAFCDEETRKRVAAKLES